MKQVVQNYRSGELSVIEVPIPACKPGGVLVRSQFSLISTGTELMKVNEAKLSLIRKAQARPDQVRKVIDSAAQLGVTAAYHKAMDRLDSLSPLGYSVCGVVTKVGEGCEHEYHVGQQVACAGNEHALHAEVNWVPRNLCAPVPAGVEPKLAAFATVGAIALHGVRRSNAHVGEVACVVGLGLVGQLVVQTLVASGVHVIGVDPVPERGALAVAAGALACGQPTTEDLAHLETVAQHTGAIGADHILLAAGGDSSQPLETALRLVRPRGCITVIGKSRLELPWNRCYEKELEIRFSRSYGPGRYDSNYELEGIDYPLEYVRWTERRNLAAFLDLTARGALSLESLVSHVFPFSEVVDVYDRLQNGDLHGVGFLFDYDGALSPAHGATVRRPIPRAERASRDASKPVRVGFIGAGNYASSTLLPHLAALGGLELATVVTTSPLSAANAQRKFGFEAASTDRRAVLEDASVEVVFIVTRHSSHAELAAQALQNGKAVFVEKPLSVSDKGLQQVTEAIETSGNSRLMVGFNRRFAPILVEMRSRFGAAQAAPSLVRYVVSAGRLDPNSWYLDANLEGSRFEGEGGHFIDTISWWLGAAPVSVHATRTTDDSDLVVTLTFDDGSLGSIAYSTEGSPRFPKETLEVTGNRRSARLENFRRSKVWTTGHPHTTRTFTVDKGQHAELAAFLSAVRNDTPMPIPLASLVATTKATLAVTRSLRSGSTEQV